MHDCTLLIQGHLARTIDRDRKGNLPSHTANPAHDGSALVVEQDIAARGRVIQTTVYTGRADAKGIGDATRAIGTIAAGEDAGETGRGIGCQVALVHLQTIGGHRASADAGAVITEADGIAQVHRGCVAIAILVGDGGAELNHVGRPQARLLIDAGVGGVDDRPLLIQRDLTGAVDRDGEGNLPTHTANTAHDGAALVVEQDIATRDGIIQTTVYTGRADAKGVGDATRAIGTIAAGEHAGEVGRGVDRQIAFVHLQAIGGHRTRGDTRTVVAEADGIAQIERGRAAVAVLVGDGGAELNHIGRTQARFLVDAGVGGVDDRPLLIQGNLAGAVDRDREGNLPT